MKFWKRWIADMQSKTTVLTLLERGAYTELLDHYYTESGPITGDHSMLYRICRAFDRHEREAIDKILGMYFHKTEAGRYLNRRAQEEIERASDYSEAQKQRSELAVAARKAKAEGQPKRERVNGHKIAFDFDKGAFTGIDELQLLAWQDAYPALIIDPEVARAAEWLKANPANRKQNYARFLVNWFSRAQDKAPRVS